MYKQIGNINLFTTGSAPTKIPSGYIAIYASGSGGFLYYQMSGSQAIKLG